MKAVISASRRTDIPAYYLKWFLEALQKGSVSVTNPLYRHKKIHVDLSPDSVEWIVFWSRNYNHFLKNYSSFSDFQLFFHFTIISHHPLLEKTALSLNHALKQVEQLTMLYGPERIIWRYDPIVLWIENDNLYTNYKPSKFSELCQYMSQFGIRHCYFSFATIYRKYDLRIRKRYPGWILVDPRIEAGKQDALDSMKQIAYKFDITLFSCCNDKLIDQRIKKGSCISGPLLNMLGGVKNVSEAKAASRPDCGCTLSIDIGDYLKHPCYIGCIYCYANPVWEPGMIRRQGT